MNHNHIRHDQPFDLKSPQSQLQNSVNSKGLKNTYNIQNLIKNI